MESQQLISDYLGKARDDVGRLQPIVDHEKLSGRFQAQLEEGNRLSQQMRSLGPQVVLPMLRATPGKLRSAQPDPVLGEESLLGYAQSVYLLGYTQLVASNVLDLVEAFGSSARGPLVEGLSDADALVRAMSAHFLGMRTIRDASSNSRVEQLFLRDQNELVHIAAAVTLLISEYPSESVWQSALHALVPWADWHVPEWKRLERDAVGALPIAFSGLAPGLFLAQARAE